jgi:hypothetical protein
MVDANKLTVGQVVTFKGYSEADMSEDDMIFRAGQQVRIEKINADGGMVAMPVEGDGPGDTVFPEEIEAAAAVQAEVAEVAAPVEEAKPAAKKASKTKAKAAAPAPVEEAPVAEEQVADDAVQPGTQVEARQDSQSVRDILAEQDALEAAKALIEQVERTYFTLGGVLSHIYAEGIHKSVGYDGKRGFADYVEAELGIQYRKAMYLINIYDYFRALGVDETRLGEIGWSKAKELVNHANAENFDELVDYAKSNTRDDLVKFLKTQNVSDGTGEGGSVKKVRLTFSLFADQSETVTRAIDAAKTMAGSDDPNQALEYICAEWSQMTESVEVSLEDAIAHLQAKYGVTLVQAGASEAEEQATVAA